jgi:hypothetical protein
LDAENDAMKNMARKPLFAPQFREKWDELPQWLRAHLDADVILVLNDHCPHTILCTVDGIKEAVGTVFVIHFATDEIAGAQIFLDCNFRPDDNPEPPYRNSMALPFIPEIDFENFVDHYELVEFFIPRNNNFDTKHVREEAGWRIAAWPVTVWTVHVSLVVDFGFASPEKPQLFVPCRLTYWIDLSEVAESVESELVESRTMNLPTGFMFEIGNCPRTAGEFAPTDDFGKPLNHLTLNGFVESTVPIDIWNDIPTFMSELNGTRGDLTRAIDIVGAAASPGSNIVASDVMLTGAVPSGSRLGTTMTASAFTGWCVWRAGAIGFGGAPAAGTSVPQPGDDTGGGATGLAFDRADADHVLSMHELIHANNRMIVAQRRHSRPALEWSLPFAVRTDGNLRDLLQLGPMPGFATTLALSESGRCRGIDVPRSAGDIIFAQGFPAIIPDGSAAAFINRRSLCGRAIDAAGFDRLHPACAPGVDDGESIDTGPFIPTFANTALAPTVAAAALSKSGANPKAVCDITVSRSPQNAVWAVPSLHI